MKLEEKRQAIIAENRRKAVEHLRTTDLLPGHCSLYDPPSGMYCALGHVGLAVGVDAKDLGISDAYELIANAVGENEAWNRTVYRMNDVHDRTLEEIGDFLAERWGI